MEELKSITRRLKEFEKKLYGFNYECHFLFDKICDGTDIDAAREIINKRFELSWQKDRELEFIEYSEFIDDISEKLLYRGDKGAGVKLSEKQESEFHLRLAEFKNLLKQKFNPLKSKVYVHPEISTSIFWGFCVLIVSRERNGVYLFEGLSSD